MYFERLTCTYSIIISCCHSNAKNMPQAVLDALRAVCVQVGGLSEEKAARLLTSMETRRKLQLETWA